MSLARQVITRLYKFALAFAPPTEVENIQFLRPVVNCQWQFNFDPFKAPVGNLQLTTLQTRLAQCLFYAYPLN